MVLPHPLLVPVPACSAYSLSRLRAFYSPQGCTEVYRLKYLLGYKERLSSAALLGTIAHRIIQQAYHGIALADAHQRVWAQVCGPILSDLATWSALDDQYRRVGNARTKARERWVQEHPQYAELMLLIEAYKRDVLSEDYTWAKRSLLTDYYRWSCQLAALAPERVLLPTPLLVEGQAVYEEDGRLSQRFANGEQARRDQFHLLHGRLANGFAVAGVPDVVAIDAHGVAWVADYKAMSRPMSVAALAEDGQLALYAELLRQNGVLAADQPVWVGHITLTADLTRVDGVQQVWARSSPQALQRLAEQVAYMDRHIQANDFLPVRGIATGSKAPCPSCGLAYACPAFVGEPPQLREEDEQ